MLVAQIPIHYAIASALGQQEMSNYSSVHILHAVFSSNAETTPKSTCLNRENNNDAYHTL